MIALTNDRNSSAATGNDKVTGIHHRPDCADFNDLLWFWRSYDTTVASSGIFFHNVVIFLRHFVCLFFCKKTSDRFGRTGKSWIMFIHTYLCDHSCDRNIGDIAI